MKTLRQELEEILAKYALSFAPTEQHYGIFMEEAVDQLEALIAKREKEVGKRIKEVQATKKRVYKRSRIDRGLCVDCPNPLNKTKYYCDYHRNLYSQVSKLSKQKIKDQI